MIRTAALCAAMGLLAACGGGGGAPAPAPVANKPPQLVWLASGDVRMAAAAQVVSATVGGLVRLDASGSTDPDGDSITYQWTIQSRPAGSAASLSASAGTVVEFRPDVLGDFTISVRATDSKGGASTETVTVRVDNRSPSSAVVVTPTFTPSTTNASPQSVTLGASIVLDASSARPRRRRAHCAMDDDPAPGRQRGQSGRCRRQNPPPRA